MTRIDNFISNAKWKTGIQILTSVFNLLNRYFFMRWMGAEYLGATSLFNSILGVLSFTDLGLTGAFSVCFYKAIAEKDRDHCISLLNALRRIMQRCVLGMMGIGLLLVPLIPTLATQTQQIASQRLCVCYVLFLLEITLGYLYTSKECYVVACQQEYVIMPITTAGSVLKIAIGLLIVFAFHSFEGYLVSGIAITMLQRIWLNLYIEKKYPETRVSRAREKLDGQDKAIVLRNVKASLNYKIAGVCVSQTDSIFLSLKTGIVMTGVVSNYVALKVNVSNLINLISSSFMPSLGNALAVETPSRQIEIYHTFLSFNVFLTGGGFAALSLLSTPTILLLFGEDACVAQNVVLVLNAATAFMIFNNSMSILTMSAGKYHIGLQVVWIGAFLNLFVTWVAVNYWGVLGVYIGTLVSELFTYLVKPFVIMKKMYGILPLDYFKITLHGIAVTTILYTLLWRMQQAFFQNSITWTRLGSWAVFCGIFFVAGYNLLMWKDRFYREVLRMIQKTCKKMICR